MGPTRSLPDATDRDGLLAFVIAPAAGSAFVLLALGFLGFMARYAFAPGLAGVGFGCVIAGLAGLALAVGLPLLTARRQRRRAGATIAALRDENVDLEERRTAAVAEAADATERVDVLVAHASALEVYAEAADAEIHALGERLTAADVARRDAEAVLEAVPATLMTIGPDGAIHRRYAREVDPGDGRLDRERTLFDVLARATTAPPDGDRLRAALARVFDEHLPPEDIVVENPLDARRTTLVAGGLMRLLHVSVRRIDADAAAPTALVTLTDVTDVAEREDALRTSAERSEHRGDLLAAAAHASADALDEFVSLATEQIAAALSLEGDRSLRARLGEALRAAHDVATGAARLRLDVVQCAAADLEDRIVPLLRSREAPGAATLAEVWGAFERLDTDLAELRSVRTEIDERMRLVLAGDEAGDEIVASFADSALAFARRSGKSITIDAPTLDTRGLPPDRRLVVKDVLAQLLRNAIVHGIEPPEERVLAGKPVAATISVYPAAEHVPGTFAFTFRDDGRGLDAAAIRARAIAAGLFSASDPRLTDDSGVARAIFERGFSTAEAPARGMGMALVRQRVVDDCGGEIAVASEPGNFCEFSFVLPLGAPSAVAAATV